MILRIGAHTSRGAGVDTDAASDAPRRIQGVPGTACFLRGNVFVRKIGGAITQREHLTIIIEWKGYGGIERIKILPAYFGFWREFYRGLAAPLAARRIASTPTKAAWLTDSRVTFRAPCIHRACVSTRRTRRRSSSPRRLIRFRDPQCSPSREPKTINNLP